MCSENVAGEVPPEPPASVPDLTAPGLLPTEGGTPKRRLLEDYSVGEAIGSGAFGVVHTCTHRTTGEEVAVKLVDKVETPVEAIMMEAELMKALSHVNIVSCRAVYHERCFICIVMDLFTGGDLVLGMQKHLKERGRIYGPDIRHIHSQMLSGVQYLHSKSIIHRDIKGDNFLMSVKDITDKSCRVALTDFGAAKLIGPGERLTKEVGTKMFWAPEFYRRNYGLKVDVWALGVIMYGLLDGRFPFKDEEDITWKAPKFPKRTEIALEDMIKCCLQKDEHARPSAEELLNHEWLRTLEPNLPGPGRSNTPEPGVGEVASERQEVMGDEADDGVAARRRELIKRLNQEHLGASRPKGPPPVHRVSSATLLRAWFQVPDKTTPGATLRFEWWDAHKACVTGPGWVSPSSLKPADGGADPELCQSTAICAQMLKDHNIDIEQFGVGDAKTLSQLASEVEDGSARLMLDATSHKKLVRVVDVVLLRLYSAETDGLILVETAEVYPDGRRRGPNLRMPGTKKFPHENARETAQRTLKELLGMGGVNVNFNFDEKEVYEEENDSPSFPGVRTVYRKEIVQCYISETRPDVLQRIGLPDGTEWSFQDKKNNNKFFSWMTEAGALEKQVKLWADGGEEVSGLVAAPIGLNEQELVKYLTRHSVDVSLYGTLPARTLKDLSKELVRGDSSLALKSWQEVIRVVDTVSVKVVNALGQILVQTDQVLPDGQKVALNRLPATRKRPDENQFIAARRVLQKFLDFDENQVILDPKKAKQYDDERGPTPAFPGLKTVYRRYIVEARLC